MLNFNIWKTYTKVHLTVEVGDFPTDDEEECKDAGELSEVLSSDELRGTPLSATTGGFAAELLEQLLLLFGEIVLAAVSELGAASQS